MSFTLTAAQRRLLGVLIEKCYTTPEQYPLTVNALVSGCNQKTNRSPITTYGEGDVIHTLQELVRRGLAKLAPPQPGSRANRYLHDITAQVPWSPKEQAILTELMLRGPQTVGELRTRADRIAAMPDLPAVQNIIDALCANSPPEIVVMPRVPGQSTVRYRHNFYTQEELDALQPAAQARDPHSAAPARDFHPTVPIPAHQVPPHDPQVEERLADLESRVASLESQLRSLSG